MSRVWLNGEFLGEEGAAIAVTDRGFLLGDGAFETMRFEAGALRRWPRHRARLSGALDWLEIDAPDFAVLEDAAAELCMGAGLDGAVMRLTVSRGAYGGGLEAPSGRPGAVLLTVRPRPHAPESVALVTVSGARRAGLVSERYKLTSYAEPLAARRLAKRAGADMALMVSAVDGSVVCADCANVFAVLDGALVTPGLDAGALPGTARAAVLDAASRGGLSIEERSVWQADLARAEAVFVTNAVSGVIPVRRLDGRALDPNHRLIRAAAALERDSL